MAGPAKTEKYQNYVIEKGDLYFDVYYGGRFVIGDFKSGADAKKWIRENGTRIR